MLIRENFCSADEARSFYDRCLYEENCQGVEWVHDATTLPLVKDAEKVLSKMDYDFHNINSDELAIRASFILMPNSVRLRVREGNVLIDNSPALLADYNREQLGWMRRAKKFLEERQNHSAEPLEFVRDYFKYGTPVYFKIREVMLYPEKFVKTADILHLRDLLSEGTSVEDRLYGEPILVPRQIPINTAA